MAGLGQVEPVGARGDRQQQHLHVGTVLQIDLESFKSGNPDCTMYVYCGMDG